MMSGFGSYYLNLALYLFLFQRKSFKNSSLVSFRSAKVQPIPLIKQRFYSVMTIHIS